MFLHYHTPRWKTNVFTSSKSELKNESFCIIKIQGEKQKTNVSNSEMENACFYNIRPTLGFHAEAMTNSNQDQKVFEWVTNSSIYLFTSLLTNDIWCVDEWFYLSGRMIFDIETSDFWHVANDIWYVHERHLLREWMTFDELTNDV